ncbi:MAG: sugar phosphate isomerase/epimerase, partial [Mariniphaga sp.]|nr:sugar phosphate isomerase/epimerase [Mariniphaga sp.]
MEKINRRGFLEKSIALGAAGLLAPSTIKSAVMNPLQKIRKDDISLAQWALVQEIRDGKWKTLDFPKVAREDFGLNGIEFVNTLFEVPHVQY